MNAKSIEIKDKISPFAQIKIEPFDTSKRYTKPHKHNKYFEIVYLKKGSGHHTIDSKKYSITRPSLFFIKREAVHFWEIETPPQGYVIIVKEAFLEHTQDKEINALLLRLSRYSYIDVDDPFLVDKLFELLCIEVKKSLNTEISVFEGLLRTLLSKMIFLCQQGQVKSGPNDKADVFLNLIEKDPKNDVAHYAGLLNTTPQNLNMACKTRFSMTASQVIAEHLDMEAKRQLSYTHKNVSEIAYSLGFKDPSHFIKYFKRKNTITPLAYRREALDI